MTTTPTETPHRRLRDRALTAAAWTLSAHGFELAAGLLSSLIMTRLLFPEAFGLLAAASAPILGLGLVSDFGVHAVIVQSPRGDQEDFLRSAWVFQLWRGFIIWGILVAICALMSIPQVHNLFPIDSVYAQKSFPLVTAVMGLGLITGGAESTAIYLNYRRLNQRPIILLGVCTRILQLIIMFLWALLWPSVWALVGGSLAANLIRLILSHLTIPGPRMALKWTQDHIQEIVHFGKWIAVASFAAFIVMQSDIVFFGLVVPGSVIGIYSIAKMLLSAAEGLLERLNTTLALPIFGEVYRSNPDNLRNRYYRYRLPIDFVSAFLSGGLLTTSNLLVTILYDARYWDAGPMLKFLAIGLALYPFQLVRSAFTATGYPHIVAGVTIVQAISLILFMLVGFELFGFFGAVFGVAIHRVVPSAVIMFLGMKRKWISVSHELRTVPIFISGVIVGETVLRLAEVIGLTNFVHHVH